MLNDYEGIGGHAEFRADLGLMYFPTLDAASGELISLEMPAMQMRQFRARRAPGADARWLCETLDRECSRFGTRAELGDDGRIALRF